MFRKMRGKGFLPRTLLESVDVRDKRGNVSKENEPAPFLAFFKTPMFRKLRGKGFLPCTNLEYVDLRAKRGNVPNENKPATPPRTSHKSHVVECAG